MALPQWAMATHPLSPIHVCYVSTAPPRRCGIAVFTESLSREATAAVPGSRRSLVALVGANGAGKTTLLRTLSGVHRASRGSIIFDGVDITRAPADRRVRSGISQVPEGRQVFGPMSVEDNLRLGA